VTKVCMFMFVVKIFPKVRYIIHEEASNVQT